MHSQVGHHPVAGAVRYAEIHVSFRKRGPSTGRAISEQRSHIRAKGMDCLWQAFQIGLNRRDHNGRHESQQELFAGTVFPDRWVGSPVRKVQEASGRWVAVVYIGAGPQVHTGQDWMKKERYFCFWKWEFESL